MLSYYYLTTFYILHYNIPQQGTDESSIDFSIPGKIQLLHFACAI